MSQPTEAKPTEDKPTEDKPTKDKPTKDKTTEDKTTPEMHSHIWGHSEEKWGTKFGTVVRIEHCEGCDKVKVFDILEEKDLGINELSK